MRTHADFVLMHSRLNRAMAWRRKDFHMPNDLRGPDAGG